MMTENKQQNDERKRREAGMSAVIEAYQTPLLRYAEQVLHNATLAQDVVQNALLKLFQNWQTGMNVDQRVKAWLFRVVHNEAVDLIRAEERRKRHQEGHVQLVMTETDGGLYEDPKPDERWVILKRCIGLLTPLQQQVVLLRLQQEMSYEQISQVIGQSTGYVGYVLHEAIAKLSEAVRKVEGGAK